MSASHRTGMIKGTFAIVALAGILGALILIERTGPADASSGSIDAALAADSFAATGPGSEAAAASLEGFTGDQFSGAAGLTGPQTSAIATLASAGLTSSPDEAIATLAAVPDLGGLSGAGNGGQRAIFRAIAGDVFKTLRALFKNVPGAIGDRLRKQLERMAGGFLGGGGGGGGTS